MHLITSFRSWVYRKRKQIPQVCIWVRNAPGTTDNWEIWNNIKSFIERATATQQRSSSAALNSQWFIYPFCALVFSLPCVFFWLRDVSDSMSSGCYSMIGSIHQRCPWQASNSIKPPHLPIASTLQVASVWTFFPSLHAFGDIDTWFIPSLILLVFQNVHVTHTFDFRYCIEDNFHQHTYTQLFYIHIITNIHAFVFVSCIFIPSHTIYPFGFCSNFVSNVIFQIY